MADVAVQPERTDLYALLDLLDKEDRVLLEAVREFMTAEVAPIINSMWTREQFPHHLIPRFGELGIGGLPYQGHGCPGRGYLLDKIALRVVQNAHITLTGCRVPEANRLQGANSFADTAQVLRRTRLGVAWEAVGCAKGAYDVALAYAKQREQFGRPIGGFQLVQDMLVRMLGNITASQCMVFRLGMLADQGTLTEEQASLAKVYTTVAIRESVGLARELMGGNGILLDHNVGRFVADAEAIYSYEGTREINTLVVGRAITGLSAFV